MRVCIYTLTRDRLPYTKRMLSGLKNCGVEYDHVILDNGSQDGSFEWLARQGGIKKLIFNKENQGLWRGIQKIIDYTHHFEGYDYVIKIDNDFEFPEDGWLARLIDVYRRSKFDILSPFVEGVCDGKGGVERLYIHKGIGVVPHVGGGCLLSTPKFYDEDLPNGYMGTGWDSWFCTGRNCGIVENIHVKHDSKKMERENKEYHKRQVEEQFKVYGKD